MTPTGANTEQALVNLVPSSSGLSCALLSSERAPVVPVGSQAETVDRPGKMVPGRVARLQAQVDRVWILMDRLQIQVDMKPVESGPE